MKAPRLHAMSFFLLITKAGRCSGLLALRSAFLILHVLCPSLPSCLSQSPFDPLALAPCVMPPRRCAPPVAHSPTGYESRTRPQLQVDT
ncbi:hypothetical protein E2C01_052322 [Portunus trituberculatus]|uniref:Secreted protein n=1 Tax=Portunus trituberculatus TaxID=210409 RepID=A0A5B7GP27_PORTR|nr:hypothetical protein [Portunus trituberculatus]